MLVHRLNTHRFDPFQFLSRDLDSDRLARATYPRVTVWEDDNAFHLEAIVPGVGADDLDISVVGNRVTLKGKRAEPEHPDATVLRREWGEVEFERSFELPLDVDNQSVEAQLENGLLALTLPKAPAHKARKVEVKALTGNK